MSFDPATPRRSADAPADEALLFDGLERALAEARKKIPDHEKTDAVEFPSEALLSPRAPAAETVKLPEPTVAAPVPFDSSAVMAVLRGAIDRYTNGDGHEQGAWVSELAEAKENVPSVGEAPRLAAGYAPDRRRLAAVVVVLFLLIGGIGYSQFGIGSGSEKVNTVTTVTVRGQAVTTATRPSTTAAAPGTLAPSSTASPSTTVKPATTTTASRATTTAPPETDPSTTDTTEPTTTSTTSSTTSTTSSTTSTTSTTTTTTTTTTVPLP